MFEETRFDHAAGEVENTLTLIAADGSRDAHTWRRLRVYTATELIRMLEGAGFDSVEAYGGLDGSELSENTWRLVLVARVAVG